MSVSEKEILSVLESLLEGRPVSPGLPLEKLSQSLVGRPISDISFLVRDAARRAVRAGRDMIGPEELTEAEKALPPKDADKRRIGFGQH